MRRAKPDANQKEIVQALRAAGRIVTDTRRLGDGFPDLFVYSPQTGRIDVLEVKMPGGRLTDWEGRWHEKHQECDFVHIVYGIEDALAAVGAFTKVQVD